MWQIGEQGGDVGKRSVPFGKDPRSPFPHRSESGGLFFLKEVKPFGNIIDPQPHPLVSGAPSPLPSPAPPPQNPPHPSPLIHQGLGSKGRMGGTQNTPCIGIVASRITLSDTPPNPRVGVGGFPEAAGAKEESCFLWAPTSKGGGSCKDSGTSVVSELGGGSAS